MYRIRLETGEETEFNSFEELSFGVASGIVGPAAEIYHERAGKWLPIAVHPEYKRAVGTAPPPPPAAHSSAGGGPGALADLIREPDPKVPVRSDRGDDGLDLLTLLDLKDLAGDPGKVQESAVAPKAPAAADSATDWVDPAEWISGLDEEEEPEAEEDAPQGTEYVDTAEAHPAEPAPDEDVLAWESALPEDLQADAAEHVEEPAHGGASASLEETPEEGPHSVPVMEIELVEEAESLSEASDEREDLLGEMLESGDSALTSHALDAEQNSPAIAGETEDYDLAPAAEPTGELPVPKDVVEEKEDAPVEDDYEFTFHGPASPPTPAPVDEPPFVVRAAAPVSDVAATPSVPAARSVPTVGRRPLDFELRHASEARGSLRDLIPFDLPKPAVLGGIAGGVLLIALFAGVIFRPGTAVESAAPAEADTAVTPAQVTPPPRPAADAEGLRLRYERAYAQSGSVLEDEIRRSGINYLFSSSRFGSEGDMLASRRAIAAARTAVVGYRAREDSIERLHPDADPSLKESRVSAELSDDILSTADGIYALLLAHLDDYAIRSGSVTFTDSGVESSYTRLLRELDRLLSVAGEARGPETATLRRIYDAVDATKPPPLAIIAPPPPISGVTPPVPRN